ncbi:MAG: VOC family protein [Bryobacteraceae bacterium]
MQLNPYLLFNGDCEAAFKFYEQCLGAKIGDIHTFKNSPMADKMPAEWRDKVMHASLKLGNQLLLGSDPPPEQYQKPQGFSVCLSANNPADAERMFHALAENGTVQMPFQKTFWSAGFGMLVDRFGIPWMVNCEEAA